MTAKPIPSVEEGLAEFAASHGEDRYQWGHYVERDDGDEWTPLVYVGREEEVRAWDRRDKRFPNAAYRNGTVVRRAIGPWEVVE